MNVTFINSMKMFGGAEVWQLDTVIELNKRGFKADIITQPNTPLAQRAGSLCTEIPIRFDTAPWTIFKLYNHFRSRKTDAIICNSIKDLKAAGIAARLAGVPVVLLSRESDVPLRNRFYYRFYLNTVATGVLVNSNATLETTLESAPWLDREKVHLLYKGIDTDRFSRTPFPDKPTLGFAGELSARKGVPELMQAWESVENELDADLLIRGAGNINIEKWRKNLSYPERVTVEPWSDDMPDFYRRISVLALPSFNEGFGLVAAEAMSAGKPVIASNCSSLPEVIGNSGKLIESGDILQLGKTIITLLSDSEECEILGLQGRQRIEQKFNKDNMLMQLELLLAGGSLE
ncbi:MAG: glycosyltransferase family 4 protein [bacterium]|nr:glycosyltransferase family 4 protein [bacterium]